jgi:hypothetical protein
MKKSIDKICGNCKLFNSEKGECCVVILHEGERIKLPMSASDNCFFEEEYFDPTTKALESFSQEIKQVKFWVENEKGEKTNKDGVVKIEYPEGFFGENIQKIINN